MPYHVEKQGDKYAVVKDSDGKVMGKHDTKEEANKQLRALYVNEVNKRWLRICPKVCCPKEYKQFVLGGCEIDGVKSYNSTEVNGWDTDSKDDYPTPQQIDDACMFFRHDFGLMKPIEQEKLRSSAINWLMAWRKTLGNI